jgi:hypothetical protein
LSSYDSCPLCQTPNEDFHHVLRCPHASRAKWRSDFVTTLRDRCHALKTSPLLLEILIGGIQAWFSLEPFDESDFPVKYAQLLREQRSIGWSQVFQGRISTQWALLQNDYYDGFPPVRGRDGTSWSRNILCHVFSQWLLLWDSRNADRHGQDATSQNIARRDQALRELALLYTYKNSVLYRDRTIFFESVQDHSTKPTHAIRQWINTYQPLIMKSIRDAKTSSIQHVRPITHYFGEIS